MEIASYAEDEKSGRKLIEPLLELIDGSIRPKSGQEPQVNEARLALRPILSVPERPMVRVQRPDWWVGVLEDIRKRIDSAIDKLPDTEKDEWKKERE